MRATTQRLLLLLYQVSTFDEEDPNSGPPRLTASVMDWLLPELSTAGRRSLWYYLEQQQLVFSEEVGGNNYLSLTREGEQALSEQFPALWPDWSTWAQQWDVYVFLDAPKQDQQFRYLRSTLLAAGGVGVQRGCYLLARPHSQRVLTELRDLYSQSLLVFGAENWLVGTQRRVIVANQHLQDIGESYSGISDEVERLLRVKKQVKGLSNAQKKQFFSAFNRFRLILTDDPGYTSVYYTELPKPQILLTQFQKVLQNAALLR